MAERKLTDQQVAMLNLVASEGWHQLLDDSEQRVARGLVARGLVAVDRGYGPRDPVHVRLTGAGSNALWAAQQAGGGRG